MSAYAAAIAQNEKGMVTNNTTRPRNIQPKVRTKVGMAADVLPTPPRPENMREKNPITTSNGPIKLIKMSTIKRAKKANQFLEISLRLRSITYQKFIFFSSTNGNANV